MVLKWGSEFCDNHHALQGGMLIGGKINNLNRSGRRDERIFDIAHERVCELINISDGEKFAVTCSQGAVLTGKQRVRQWVRTQIFFDGEFITASDSSCLIATLRKVGQQCIDRGYYLNVVGLLPDFRESGLSANTGYGYAKNMRQHMLA